MFPITLPGAPVSRVVVCLPVGQATVGGAGGGAVILCLVGGGGGRVGAGSGQGRTEAWYGGELSVNVWEDGTSPKTRGNEPSIDIREDRTSLQTNRRKPSVRVGEFPEAWWELPVDVSPEGRWVDCGGHTAVGGRVPVGWGVAGHPVKGNLGGLGLDLAYSQISLTCQFWHILVQWHIYPSGAFSKAANVRCIHRQQHRLGGKQVHCWQVWDSDFESKSTNLRVGVMIVNSTSAWKCWICFYMCHGVVSRGQKSLKMSNSMTWSDHNCTRVFCNGFVAEQVCKILQYFHELLFYLFWVKYTLQHRLWCTSVQSRPKQLSTTLSLNMSSRSKINCCHCGQLNTVEYALSNN